MLRIGNAVAGSARSSLAALFSFRKEAYKKCWLRGNGTADPVNPPCLASLAGANPLRPFLFGARGARKPTEVAGLSGDGCSVTLMGVAAQAAPYGA
jgi:hypothetical protein